MKNATEAHFRQRLIKYAKQHGVTKAAIRCHLSRQMVHKWLKRYDGTLASLDDGQKQLAVYQRKSNTYWKTCLDMRSPNEVLASFDAEQKNRQ